MPKHAEKRRLPYAPEQMFDLVADIERYPEFLPWCKSLQIRRRDRDGALLTADMAIGFKAFRETFTSRVILARPGRIDVAYERGPFKYLKNHWVFASDGEGRCIVEFSVDFQFRSKLLEFAIGAVFHEATHKMMRAFEDRAKSLYG